MRWRWLVVVVSMATVAEGQEVADAGDAAVPSVGGGVALARAVADRFVECAAAEGEPLAEADRRLVEASVAPLAVATALGIGAEACTGDPAAEARCVDLVHGVDCATLAESLDAAPLAVTLAGIPPWADGHARSMVQRVSACLVAERDGGASDAELTSLGALHQNLATALGAMVSSGRCHVAEVAMPACALSVQALSCEAIAGHLEEDIERFAVGPTPECAGFVVCGAAQSGAGAHP